MPLEQVARTFGDPFTAQLEKLPLEEWVGPVMSGFGAHLVRISARTTPAPPPLAAVRPQVAREWEAERRQRALAQDYQRLREKYAIVIEAKLPVGAAP